MKSGTKILLTVVLGFLSISFLSGCMIFEGGMNTVEPPSLSTNTEPKQESILNDLSPARARDMMISESSKQDDR